MEFNACEISASSNILNNNNQHPIQIDNFIILVAK